MKIKEGQKVKKGQWYSHCCHLDLAEAKEDFIHDIEEFDLDVWDSEREALTELFERWKKQHETSGDCIKEIGEIALRLVKLGGLNGR